MGRCPLPVPPGVAGCEVQLPRGLEHEQALWLGRGVLGAGGPVPQLLVGLWEEALAAQAGRGP